MFLDGDQLWIIGNIPDLQLFHRIYSQVLHTLHPNLPTTLDDWKHAQQNDPTFLQSLESDSLASMNGLTVYNAPDFPSRILVPPTLRDQLIRQHHYDLQHVSYPLARQYF
jgi:hypothetical protein